MRDIGYYKKAQKSLILEYIKDRLRLEPVKIALDCTIESLSDLEKQSVKIAIDAKAKREARKIYEEMKKPCHRFVMPKMEEVNGIKVEEGVILPVYASGVVEDHEITTQMLSVGLYLSLKHDYDEYYQKLFKACIGSIPAIPDDAKKMLDGTYWE